MLAARQAANDSLASNAKLSADAASQGVDPVTFVYNNQIPTGDLRNTYGLSLKQAADLISVLKYSGPVNVTESGNKVFDKVASYAASSYHTADDTLQSFLDNNKLTYKDLKATGLSDQDFKDITSMGYFPAAGDKSPFVSKTEGSEGIPSVSGYSSGAPAGWGGLYSSIQSGNLRLTPGTFIDPNNADNSISAYGLSIPGSSNEIATKVGDNLYKITSRYGDYTTDFYVRADPYSGYVEPISNPQQISSYRSNYSNNGFLGGLVSGISNAVQDLGPIASVALGYATGGLGSMIAEQLGISQAAGTALASAGVQVASGAPLDQALQKAATSFIGGTVGSSVNSLADEVAAAQNYGTDLGSQQTSMLAAQEAGMGSATDVAGNVVGKLAGGTVSGVLSGQDIGTAAAQGAVNAGINLGSSLISNIGLGNTDQTNAPDIFTDTTAAEVPATAEEVPNETDVTGEPIGGTRIPLDNGGFQTNNPDGSVTYEDPDGSVYKVNPDGTYTTESMGQTNTYNPATGEFTQPTSTATTTTTPTGTTSGGLSQQQIESLLKTGAGLLTGAAGATALANALGGSSSGSTTSATPTTGAQAGTYSGLNPYNAAYFQQVQQNYNRLFPTAPADVVTPLQSWYSTQYVPDTSISKKLFGV